MSALRTALARLAGGASLSQGETAAAVLAMMEETADPAQTGAFLMALAMRGETADELIGAARAMRSRMTPVTLSGAALDIVGTGGDGRDSVNISTAAAIIVAAAGLPVAKHGNRSASSRAGSADVAEALGLPLARDAAAAQTGFAAAGFCFLFAPAFHAALASVAPTRRALGVRTLFNLVGPLCNPAGASRLLLGVYDPRWLEPMAQTLAALGVEAAWVVHGDAGTDELTTSGPSQVCALEDGRIRHFCVDAAEAGLPLGAPDDVTGGDARHNAGVISRFLAGETMPFGDTVLLNAGAALLIGGASATLRDGVEAARAAVQDGRAAARLAVLRACRAH